REEPPEEAADASSRAAYERVRARIRPGRGEGRSGWRARAEEPLEEMDDIRDADLAIVIEVRRVLADERLASEQVSENRHRIRDAQDSAAVGIASKEGGSSRDRDRRRAFDPSVRVGSVDRERVDRLIEAERGAPS